LSGIPAKDFDEDQNRIRRYLLGGLDDSERQTIEERIFTDPAFFDRVSMTEDELLEDYAFEILSQDDAEKFASRLLVTPEQIQRLQTTKALRKYIDDSLGKADPAPGGPFFLRIKPAWRAAIGAVLIIAVGIGIWVFLFNSLDRTLARLNSPGNDNEMKSDFPIGIDMLRFRSGSASESNKQFAVPKGANVVQLRLLLGPLSYNSYQVSLITGQDSTLFTLDNRAPINTADGTLLVVRVPARVFAPGEYRLALKGKNGNGQVDDLGSYTFSISESSNH